MPGSETVAKASRTPRAIGYNTLWPLPFDTIAAVAASTVATTIQAQVQLPATAKILGAVASYTALTVQGTAFFNIIAGNGTYETTNGVPATVAGTVAGTIHTGDIITLTFTIPASLAGTVGAPQSYGPVIVTVSYTVKSTDTTATLVATGLLNAFNSTEVLNALFFAWQAAGVINFSAINCGTAYNGITYLSSVTGTGATTTFTASGTTAGGTANTGYNAVGTNNTFQVSGSNTFVVPTANTPLFEADQALYAPAPGITNQGQFPYTTQNFDALYPQGTVLTLRAIVPAGNAIANFKAVMLGMFYDPQPSYPNNTNFDPNHDVG